MKAIRMANDENVPINNAFYDGCDKNQKQQQKFNIENQSIQSNSHQKKFLKSMNRIARSLNKVNIDNISNEKYSKVCLILIKSDQGESMNKVGELNDGYLFGLYHNRLGFKVFYAINGIDYLNFLRVFLNNTTENLTIFYSGYDNIIDLNFNEINNNLKIVFISDCKKKFSFFDVQTANSSEIISFAINKINHGVFIYYYCKTIFKDPKITPKVLLHKMNHSLSRFKETFEFKATNKLNENEPIYKNCVQCACDLFDELIDDED